MRREVGNLGKRLTLAVVLWLGATTVAAAAESTEDNLQGLWTVTVVGTATYDYAYAFAAGALVTVGNIDANWDGQGSSFGATVGSYERLARQSYRVREWTWAFDPDGGPAGHSEFVGTYTVGRNGKTLTGEGVWTLYDLQGTAIYTEPLTVSGRKLEP